MFRLLGLLSIVVFLLAGVILSGISYRNSITPEGIIVHHAALPVKLQGHAVDAETIDRLHEQRGYGAFYWGRVYHVGYHFIILPDGTIQQGRPEHCRGSHAAGYDSFLGICLIGNFSANSNPDGDRGLKEPTEAQIQALTALVKRLRTSYHIPLDRIRRHSDVNPHTECPGDRFSLQQLMDRF
jgi:N-acetylmuramoyl-L-alanine amidase